MRTPEERRASILESKLKWYHNNKEKVSKQRENRFKENPGDYELHLERKRNRYRAKRTATLADMIQQGFTPRARGRPRKFHPPRSSDE